MQDPTCRICAIVAALPGQRFVDQDDLLLIAARQECTCVGTKHRPLARHPHTRQGCQGYRPRRVAGLSGMPKES